jgi:hypothetical protein
MTGAADRRNAEGDPKNVQCLAACNRKHTTSSVSLQDFRAAHLVRRHHLPLSMARAVASLHYGEALHG